MPFNLGNQELKLAYGSLTKLNKPSASLFVANFTPIYTDLEERLRALFAPYANPLRIRPGRFGLCQVRVVVV